MSRTQISNFLFIFFILTLTNLKITTAQNDQPPLGAPLVATTAAAMDKILLYDMSGGRRELSFGAFEHQVWGFSPDGCRVLFTLSETGGLPQIYTAKIDGSEQRQLLRYDDLPAQEWGAWEPDWSPDGTRIAFTMSRGLADADNPDAQEHHIGWINMINFEPQTPEFYSVTGREFSPRWSPDGAWLAYVSYDERVPGADAQSTALPTNEPPPGQAASPSVPLTQEADLWVVSADGETKYPLTTFETGSVRAPRWSPDGALIGFIYSPSANNDTFWMIANQQGSIPTQLSYLWNLTLDQTWLPDSSAMLASARDFRDTGENLLWRIPLVGNADNDATLLLSEQTLHHHDYPRFNADGRWLAFRSDYVLIAADLQAGTFTSLDSNLPGNTPPVWSPAGYLGEAACP